MTISECNEYRLIKYSGYYDILKDEVSIIRVKEDYMTIIIEQWFIITGITLDSVYLMRGGVNE